MNRKGRILNSALLKQGKYDRKGKSYMDLYHNRVLNKRIEDLIVKSHVLAIRTRIRKFIDECYNSFKDIDEIVGDLYPMTDSWFIDLECFDMGFGELTDKDIDKYDLDFCLYIPEIRECVKEIVIMEIRKIESGTLSMNL